MPVPVESSRSGGSLRFREAGVPVAGLLAASLGMPALLGWFLGRPSAGRETDGACAVEQGLTTDAGPGQPNHPPPLIRSLHSCMPAPARMRAIWSAQRSPLLFSFAECPDETRPFLRVWLDCSEPGTFRAEPGQLRVCWGQPWWESMGLWVDIGDFCGRASHGAGPVSAASTPSRIGCRRTSSTISPTLGTRPYLIAWPSVRSACPQAPMRVASGPERSAFVTTIAFRSP
jgi:hypothetical protein